MKELLEAVVDFVDRISPARVRAVASEFRGRSTPDEVPGVNALVDTPAARAVAGRVLEAWSQSDVSGDVVAGLLLGAVEARLRAERDLSVELVWTGPTTRFAPMRRTEQVLLDLIESATASLFLVSFVAYEVPSVVSALNAAISRGVRLSILLEPSTGAGAGPGKGGVAAMSAKVPGAVMLAWKNKPSPFAEGRVHAKIAVADRSRAFVTSANLTGFALEKNMEAGVLINGGPIPQMLADHLDALAAVGVIGAHS